MRARTAAADLAILNSIAGTLNRAGDVAEALSHTLSRVAELLGLDTGWVWLIEPDSGQFYRAATHNLPPYLEEPVRMTGQPCWCLEEFRQGRLQPQNIDIMECSRLRAAARKQRADTRGLRCHASIPLYFQERPLGVMNISGPSWRRLTAGELRLLSTIAYQVGIAVERARLAEEGMRLARAEERARLAREIHDTLAQGLTAIALQIEGAAQHVEDAPQVAQARLQRALQITRDHLEEARRSVMDLRLMALVGKPLSEALAVLARTFTSDTGVAVHLRTDLKRSLPLRLEAELFRIAQEALTNVRRHANARRVEIALSADGEVRLSVADDGGGFEPRSVSTTRHGLLGMRERARLLCGRLRVHSRPGKGTRVVATLPWPAIDA